MKIFLILTIILFEFVNVTNAQWVKTSAPGEAIVRALETDGTNIFAGIHGDVYISTDNGSKWEAVVNGLSESRTCMSLALMGGNVIAGKADGAYVSSDNGSNWKLTNLVSDVKDLVISGPDIFAGTWLSGIWKREISEFLDVEKS